MRASFPILLAALSLLRPALPEERPPFSVLRVTRGEEIDFLVVDTAKVAEARRDQEKKAQQELSEWEKDRDAYLDARKGQNGEYPDLPPLPAEVALAGRFQTREEAQSSAQEKQKRADARYALIRVTLTDSPSSPDSPRRVSYRKRSHVEALPMRSLRERQCALRRDWCERLSQWFKFLKDAEETARVNAYQAANQKPLQAVPTCRDTLRPKPALVERIAEDLDGQEAALRKADAQGVGDEVRERLEFERLHHMTPEEAEAKPPSK